MPQGPRQVARSAGPATLPGVPYLASSFGSGRACPPRGRPAAAGRVAPASGQPGAGWCAGLPGRPDGRASARGSLRPPGTRRAPRGRRRSSEGGGERGSALAGRSRTGRRVNPRGAGARLGGGRRGSVGPRPPSRVAPARTLPDSRTHTRRPSSAGTRAHARRYSRSDPGVPSAAPRPQEPLLAWSVLLSRLPGPPTHFFITPLLPP
jgi:hypothetical protein